MKHTPPPQAEIDQWHRWFAVECNNTAWGLAEKSDRSEEESQQMLQCAIASAWHWSQVGQEVHEARAEMLLAWAHAQAGLGDAAVKHAQQARALVDQPVDGVHVWDKAFMPLTEAIAAQAARDTAGYRRALEATKAARESLGDPKDLAVFDQFAALIPNT